MMIRPNLMKAITRQITVRKSMTQKKKLVRFYVLKSLRWSPSILSLYMSSSCSNWIDTCTSKEPCTWRLKSLDVKCYTSLLTDKTWIRSFMSRIATPQTRFKLRIEGSTSKINSRSQCAAQFTPSATMMPRILSVSPSIPTQTCQVNLKSKISSHWIQIIASSTFQ